MRVDDAGLSVGSDRFAWRHLPYLCRSTDGRGGGYLEMRSPSGPEVRVFLDDPFEGERLQEAILLRLTGVTRDDIPRRGEEVEILGEDEAVPAAGGVAFRHLDYVYVDVPGEGLGGYWLDRIRRLPGRP